VGDLNFMQRAIGKMSDLSSQNGRTVLFVSHNPMAVKNLCNKGIVIDQGKVILEMSPIDEVISKYKEVLGLE
jgi:lipopolysaccharide transport system ATP-binding protein